MRNWGFAVITAAAAAATACGGSSGSTASTSVRSAQTIQVADNANGTTVTAHVGDTVSVTLHNTYWTLATPDGHVLVTATAPSSAPGGSGCPHIPGSGCGSVTATYRADTTGTTRLTAHRDSCGEAMRCGPGQGDWAVTVRVT
jgi:hypothetical protein